MSELDVHLLMNHSLPGVNAGYIDLAGMVSRVGVLRRTRVIPLGKFPAQEVQS